MDCPVALEASRWTLVDHPCLPEARPHTTELRKLKAVLGEAGVNASSNQAGSETCRGSMMPKTTRFDAADYLDTGERQVAYITAAFETGDAEFVRDALGIVARARGIGEIAKPAGLNRET